MTCGTFPWSNFFSELQLKHRLLLPFQLEIIEFIAITVSLRKFSTFSKQLKGSISKYVFAQSCKVRVDFKVLKNETLRDYSPNNTHALWYWASALLNHIFANIHVYHGSLGRKTWEKMITIVKAGLSVTVIKEKKLYCRLQFKHSECSLKVYDSRPALNPPPVGSWNPERLAP